MTVQRFDVLIVGAGIAGSALAVALSATGAVPGLGGAKPGLRVALVETQPLVTEWPEPDPPLSDPGVDGYDPRVSALTAASSGWLSELGIWPEIVARRTCGYRHMQVWDGAGTGIIDFDAATVGQPALGHIVENRLLLAALHRRLRSGAVQLFSPAQVESLEAGGGSGREIAPEGNVEVRLADGCTLSARLLVGADGGRSMVRAWSGLAVREWDYGHRALVATVACEYPHGATAWQRFMPEGPLAFLPLAGGGERYCSIVWSTLPERADELLAQGETQFCRTLGAAFEHRLGTIRATSPRYAFPLRQMHAVDYVRTGIALVGDAAHTIHPLAGQGINLGLLDARVLAEELLRGARRGLGPGDASVLNRYQRRRKGHNLAMMAAMEGFKRLFESRRPALMMSRNTGLGWLQGQEWLKRPLIRSAMGL